MTSIELLCLQFPGKVYLCLEEVATLSGFAVNTIRNRIRARTWPIPVHREGPNAPLYFDIRDVAAYIDQRSAVAAKRRPGRPTKAEQMARSQAAH